MPDVATLDHVVINARADMAAAERAFADLGFVLTPRGYHTLGSINALTIFRYDYLELLGVPADKPDARPELMQTPFGLNGIVFKTADADATYRRLTAFGIDAAPPKSFSRPVTLESGETADAKFRTVTLPAATFPAGRFYFCEHATPELVWRPEWQSHENGVTGFDEIVTVLDEPAELAGRVAAILDAPLSTSGTPTVDLPHGVCLTFLTPPEYTERFGPAGIDVAGRPAALGAVVFNHPLGADERRRMSERTETFGVMETTAETRVTLKNLETLLVFPS